MSSLRRTLQRVREDRKAGKAPPKKLTPKPHGHGSVFSNCGPNGERREHPTILGLRWLQMVGLALEQLDIAAGSRVSAEAWENDGCVTLYLQKPLKRELSTPIVAIGNKISPGTQHVVVGAGEWWGFRIPTGAINSHDMSWTLKAILGEQKSNLVMQSSETLRAIHGH